MQRPINKDYYFIDFHATIDAIKYRVFNLTEQVKALYKPTEERKEYFCPRCRAEWSQFQVLDRVGPEGFLCHRCDGLLERTQTREGESTGHEKQSRLMSQLEPLLKLLQQIDSQDVPANDFENAIAHAVPVQRDPNVGISAQTVPVNGSANSSTAVKGQKHPTIAPLEISVTDSSTKTAAEQAAEADRKATLAAQNVLPVWHTTSTVSGPLVGSDPVTKEARTTGSASKEADEEGKANPVLDEVLNAYYEEMAREKEKQAQEDRDADNSSDDEEGEDEDFEDVAIEENGEISDPSAIAPEAKSQSSALDVSKQKDSESGSSAPVTSTSTPAAGNESAPAAKKVKFDEGIPAGGDSDEDDEAEFEDAL